METETTRHTCNRRQPGKPLPFGRRAPRGTCPRCDELADGAPAREGWSATRDGRQGADEIRAHFASARHRSGGCGPMCTYGDW